MKLALQNVVTSIALPARMTALAVAIGCAASILSVALTTEDRWPAGILLSMLLAWASVVDVDRKILPNVLTLGLIAFGLAYAATENAQVFVECALGAAVGYAAFFIVNELYARLRNRSGLGMGDAKLLSAAGAWLGWAALPYVVLIASAGAVVFVVANRLFGAEFAADKKMAFGPFLSAAFWALWTADITAHLSA